MTDTTAPERVFVHHYHWDHLGHPFEGWWHCDEAAAGPGICPQGYVRADLMERRIAEAVAEAVDSERAVQYSMARAMDALVISRHGVVPDEAAQFYDGNHGVFFPPWLRTQTEGQSHE